MNFQQLEYILAIEREGHFAHAAHSCHVTQATLSAMVKKLEQELGLLLFDRSHHPILPTEEGKVILLKAREILDKRDALISASQGKQSEISGVLKLGIIPTVANTLLPIILKPILDTYPKLELDIVEITTDDLVERLLHGGLDAGILATPTDRNELLEEVLYYESLLVYGISEEEKQYVLPEELYEQNIWFLDEGHCFKNQAMTLCDFKQGTQGNNNLNFAGSSFETLLSLTDSFGGYTLLPELFTRTLPRSRQKKTRAFVHPLPVREISLVTYRPLLKRKALSAVADIIRKKIPPLLRTNGLEKKEMQVLGI